jgi:hypothetical protein
VYGTTVVSRFPKLLTPPSEETTLGAMTEQSTSKPERAT